MFETERAQSSLIVADYILLLSSLRGRFLTPFELIKRVFISHGRYLAYTDRPLINDRIEAWKHGPVIPVLYHELKLHGEQPISALRYCNTPIQESERRHTDLSTILTPAQKDIITGVVTSFGDWDMGQIYQLCHEPGSPWAQCYTGKYGVEIPDHVIRDYYKQGMVVR